MKTPILETPRLQLRPLHTDNLPAIYAYAAKPEYATFLPYPSPTSVAELADVFAEALTHDADNDVYLWAVCLREKSELVGLVEFSLDDPTEASLHYEIADHHWHRGYATEAAQAAISWAFGQFSQLQTLLADTHGANRGARRVLEKCGFQPLEQQLVMWEKSNEKVLLCRYRRSR
ncbi:MAG: GNAT family N-acetyltransferase [Cyanobacteria bacterium P01_A01_bin.105]